MYGDCSYIGSGSFIVMGRSRTVHLEMTSGNANGINIASMPNSSIKGSVVPTIMLGGIRDLNEPIFDASCIYIMLGLNKTETPLAYIGESHSGFLSRQNNKDHKDRHDEWCDRILMFARHPNQMDATTLKYIEAKLFELVSDAGTFKLTNSNDLSVVKCSKKMTRSALSEANAIFEDIILYIPILGEPDVINSPPNYDVKHEIFELDNSNPKKGRVAGAKGQMIFIDGKYVVLKGSGSMNPTDSLSDSIVQKRKDLIATGVIKIDKNGNGIFQKDHVFGPSESAKIVRGASTSQWEWKSSKTGKNFQKP